jgi:hypothetical protein
MHPSALEIEITSADERGELLTIDQQNDHMVFHRLIPDTCIMEFPENLKVIKSKEG